MQPPIIFHLSMLSPAAASSQVQRTAANPAEPTGELRTVHQCCHRSKSRTPMLIRRCQPALQVPWPSCRGVNPLSMNTGDPWLAPNPSQPKGRTVVLMQELMRSESVAGSRLGGGGKGVGAESRGITWWPEEQGQGPVQRAWGSQLLLWQGGWAGR